MEPKQERANEHEVRITNRESATIKGVLHVESFDEEEIILDTNMGTLTVKGEGLHIKQLDLEQGDFEVEGLINAMQYTSVSKGKGAKGKGFLQRLLK